MLFHLGAGAGGLQEFCHRYADSFHRWWDDLGDARLSSELSELLMTGVQQEANGKTVKELAFKRDALIASLLQATQKLR